MTTSSSSSFIPSSSTAAAAAADNNPPPPLFQTAPPLDPAWLAHERTILLPLTPNKPPALDPIQKQPFYAAECRRRNAAMMAAGARDHHLSQGITTQYVPYVASSSSSSKEDGRNTTTPPPPPPPPTSSSSSQQQQQQQQQQPVLLQYDREIDTEAGVEPKWVVIYFHGGGLVVGEADSEDLSCRRILTDTVTVLPRLRVYSVGYRLKPQHPASVCLADSVAAVRFVRETNPAAKVIVMGSSSGGELAALATQQLLLQKEREEEEAFQVQFHGVLLRCPVTSDAFRGKEYVPEMFRTMHTSAEELSFQTSLFTRLDMDGPRDGLDRLPLEAPKEELKGMPRTWIQLCTNDTLYSDGACYSILLRDAGVEVRTDVVYGWPHTFWLKAPQLDRALEAEEAMVQGLKWVAGVEE